MSWFGESKDLIAIVLATLAVILSLVTVLILSFPPEHGHLT